MVASFSGRHGIDSQRRSHSRGRMRRACGWQGHQRARKDNARLRDGRRHSVRWSEFDIFKDAVGRRWRRSGVSRRADARDVACDWGRTVLFGAQSFWEGVDVAGEALSCVVIARLQFAQVGDPVVEARGERVEREGGSSFRVYLLPEAVIRFRQGFDRLIRTKSDHGVVVVTDPRLVTKNYGAVFRKSIPASVHTVVSNDELLDRVSGFFESGNPA